MHSPREQWYGYNNKNFRRWWHRKGKAAWGKGDITIANSLTFGFFISDFTNDWKFRLYYKGPKIEFIGLSDGIGQKVTFGNDGVRGVWEAKLGDGKISPVAVSYFGVVKFKDGKISTSTGYGAAFES
jgi:hypothetical protein